MRKSETRKNAPPAATRRDTPAAEAAIMLSARL
jgi:hypothetical protein